MRFASLALALILSSPALAQGVASFNGSAEKCMSLAVTGDSAIVGWTSTGGSHYTEVDEGDSESTCYLDDSSSADYITAPAATLSTALFDLANTGTFVAASPVIEFVVVAWDCERGSGSGKSGPTVTVSLRISGSDYAATGMSCIDEAADVDYSTAWYTNPDSGLAWTSSDIDSMQLYVEKNSTSETWDAQLNSLQLFVFYRDDETPDPDYVRTGGGE